MKINIKEIINNMKYRNVYLVLAIILAVVMISSGTYAFWTLLFEEDTSIAFTVPDADVECNGDGGAPLGTAGQTTLVPTTCDDSEHAFQREITINTKNNSLLNLSLGLNINHIGEGLSNSQNLRYAITTDPDSCSDGVVASGNFYGMQNGGQLTFFDHMYIDKPGIVDLDLIYYLYVWLDKEETSIETANQYLDVELFGSCYGGATYSEDNPEDNIYIISYDGMGGQNVPGPQFKKHDETLQLSNFTPYNSGYEFLGWNTEPDYSGTTYQIEDEYSANEAVTLYAMWNTGVTAIYSEDDNSLRFYVLDSPVPVGDTYNGLTVTEAWTGFENVHYDSSLNIPWNRYYKEITNVVVEDTISPLNISYWFFGLGNCSNFDVTNLNTSHVQNMEGAFYHAGENATTFNLDLSGWDVSSVTNMGRMFQRAGYSASSWSLDLGDWNTSNVTNMNSMFYSAGENATTFNLDLSGWDTSNVTNMNNMFYSAGYSATTWSIGDLSGWDTSNVTNMNRMFYSAGYSATTFNLDLSGWDTSNVTHMVGMFDSAGYSATTWSIGDLSGWDVSSVTNMDSMFRRAGENATTFNLDLSGWDVSSVSDMDNMFDFAGYSATTWSIGDLSGWDVSSVTAMFRMFRGAGFNSTNDWELDLSGWDVSKVTDYSNFKTDTESRIISPWDSPTYTYTITLLNADVTPNETQQVKATYGSSLLDTNIIKPTKFSPRVVEYKGGIYGAGAIITDGTVEAPLRSLLDFDGWWTANTGGVRVISTTNALISNVSGYTDASGNWIGQSDVTLYARWKPVEVTLATVTKSGYHCYWSTHELNSTAATTYASGATIQITDDIPVLYAQCKQGDFSES